MQFSCTFLHASPQGEACCQATAQSVWLKLWFPIYHLRDWCGSFPLMLCRAAGMDSCTAAPHKPNESLLWNETFGSHGVRPLHPKPTWHRAAPSECHPGLRGQTCGQLTAFNFTFIYFLREFVSCCRTRPSKNLQETEFRQCGLLSISPRPQIKVRLLVCETDKRMYKNLIHVCFVE